MNSHQRRVKRRRNQRLEVAFQNGNAEVWARYMRTRDWKRFRRRLARAFGSARNTLRDSAACLNIPVMPINITFEIVDPGFAKAAP
jgi:hypothetical protein